MDINYYGQVSCIDRQIEELQARRNAISRGYCYTGYHNVKSYIDPYNLAGDESLAETTLDCKMEDKRTFTEIFAVVKYKIEHNIPMSTAKEELMEDFINDWVEIFGYNTI